MVSVREIARKAEGVLLKGGLPKAGIALLFRAGKNEFPLKFFFPKRVTT